LLRASIGAVTRDVPDEAVELVGDFSQVLIRPAAKFIDFRQMFSVGPQYLRLPLFYVRHHDHGVLEFLDRCLHSLVGHGLKAILAQRVLTKSEISHTRCVRSAAIAGVKPSVRLDLNEVVAEVVECDFVMS
jgi:hypothetical protein